MAGVGRAAGQTHHKPAIDILVEFEQLEAPNILPVIKAASPYA